MPRVAVVGAGAGGVSAARHLKDVAGARLEVVLFEKEPAVEYLPATIPILLGRTPRERWRQTLSVEGVELRTGEVEAVSAAGVVAGREDHEADAVVAAPGLALDAGRIPDAPNVRAFWDPAGAEAAAEAAASLQGGTVAVVISSLPYRCPPAPYGMAMELAARYREEGRDVRVVLTTPEEVPVAAVGGAVPGFLDRSCAGAGVGLIKGFDPDLGSLATGELRSKNGERVPFDLALVVPPHARSPMLAGLPGDGPLVPVSPSFESEQPNLFVVGDAAMAPLPRAADAASFGGRTAADAVLRRLGLSDGSDNPLPQPECYVGHGGGRYSRILLRYPDGLPPAGAAHAEIDGPSEDWASGFEESFGRWRALRSSGI